MQHIDFNNDDFIAVEDSSTIETLYDFCDRNIFSRTFSNWHQMTTARELLQMLGFTIRYLPAENGYARYSIESWFGNDSDCDSVELLRRSI